MRLVLNLFLASLLLSACSTVTNQKPAEHPHYRIELELDPADQYIACEGELILPPIDDTVDRLTFYLHRQLVVPGQYKLLGRLAK